MTHGLLANPHRRHLALTALVGAGLLAYLTGQLEFVYGFNVALLLALIGGFPIYFSALSELARGKISADLAVGLAAIAALAIGQYAVAAEVVLIMLIGEALENFAVGRTRSAIAELLKLRPHEARVRRNGQERVVPADEVRADDVVIVRPGDRIPVDGKVLSGTSSVDQSPITGESLPADKAPGDEVFAGTINLYGALELAVERLGEDTTLEQIIHLVEEAEEAKAPTERLADKYATFFVPIVLAAAGLTYLITREPIRSVAVLVVACPCALVLATPTAIAAGIGRLVRKGVLVKGGSVLERLGRLRAVIFDKTGTLTLAKLRIARIVPAPGHDATEVLALGASVERHSEHPIGQLIVERAREESLELLDAGAFEARPGLGAQAVVAGQQVRVGSPRFLEVSDVSIPGELQAETGELSRAGCTVVLVARGAEVIGAVAVEDTVRPEARETLERLRDLGIERIVMLTGDNAAAGRSVADALAIRDARSDLLPADKVAAVRQIQAEAAPVAMVGDGINDAPSLVAADVGVAMAEIGTDVAIASADLVLVGDDLSKLADAVVCGRRVLRVIWQNILGFAIVFNVAAVVVASLGWIAPVVAAVLHQVSSLVVCLNSLRLLVDFGRWRERAAESLRAFGGGIRARRRRLLAAGGSALFVAWLLSGIHVVRIGEVAVVQHFGKVARSAARPGLHYRLPYPFGRHRTVRVGELRRVEVGFRTVPGEFTEPPAYEWNVQHRGGRWVRRDAEATVWAGDMNLVDVNLIVHYRVADPLAALFTVGERLPDGASKWDMLVRDATEAALRAEMSQRTIDEILSTNRAGIEDALHRRVAAMMEQYGAGFEVRSVCLGDVHPPLEVVPAFRDVVSALEEKEAMINQAQAYRNRTQALARGQAEKRKLAAEAWGFERWKRAEGRAKRFTDVARAYAIEPALTRLRLYLETIEQVLAGRRKIILDKAAGQGRRMLFLGRTGLWPALAAPAGQAAGEEPIPREPEGNEER